MPQGYEVQDANGQRAWWDGKKLTPLTEAGFPDAGVGRVTEGERTAGFLATRVADSARGISDIEARNPGVARPNPFEALASSWGKPGTANLFRSGDRQRVAANQLDLLDAALTLGTGAAYTKEQLENYRSTYFPGLTDKPEAVAEKRRKLMTLLSAAKVKAGGAAPPQLEAAIRQMQSQYGLQPGTSGNPIELLNENRSRIGEGAYFRAGDGKTYRQKKGAGFPGRQSGQGGGQRLTPEQAARLAPGTRFIGMDGVERIRQ